MSVFIWLTPTLLALFFYGIAQGLVKKNISEVSPARFCLYYVVAKSLVNLTYFAKYAPTSFNVPEAHSFLLWGLLAYLLDGIGWIFYYESIVLGPITIVGTLSAAYPATTILFARLLLGESLSPLQYVGVACVILGCVGLAYSPPNNNPDESPALRSKKWIWLAGSALLIWGLSQTIVKYAYQFPHSNDAYMALLNTFGGAFTLGLYGFYFGRHIPHSLGEWKKSFIPMAMMAGGDLGVIIATQTGPVSVVSPLSGAYPVVTLAFAKLFLKESISRLQWIAIAMVLLGVYLAPGTGT